MKEEYWKSSEQADKWFRELSTLDAAERVRELGYVTEIWNSADRVPIFEYDTDHNHAWYLLGLAYEEGGNFAEAAKCFRVSAEIWPNDADAYVAFSNVERDAASQVEVLEEGLKFVDDPRIRFNLANAYLDLGDPKNALVQLNAIPKSWSEYSDVKVSISQADTLMKKSQGRLTDKSGA